jgi:hypothetical protein
MKNINEYNKEVFLQSFSKTDTYARLIKDFDIVTFGRVADFLLDRQVTPRQHLARSWPGVRLYQVNFRLHRSTTLIIYWKKIQSISMI